MLRLKVRTCGSTGRITAKELRNNRITRNFCKPERQNEQNNRNAEHRTGYLRNTRNNGREFKTEKGTEELTEYVVQNSESKSVQNRLRLVTSMLSNSGNRSDSASAAIRASSQLRKSPSASAARAMPPSTAVLMLIT